MGTRSTVRVINTAFDRESQLVCIYTQFDGYPSGVGADIQKILGGGRSQVCNGIGEGCNVPEWFNGAGCLAAHLVKNLKEGIGGVYIVDPDHRESYDYALWVAHGQPIRLVLTSFGEKVYDGPLSAFDPLDAEK